MSMAVLNLLPWLRKMLQHPATSYHVSLHLSHFNPHPSQKIKVNDNIEFNAQAT